MTDLTKLTLTDALDGMTKGDFSSVELTKAHIDACMDGADLNAFITTTFEVGRERFVLYGRRENMRGLKNSG